MFFFLGITYYGQSATCLKGFAVACSEIEADYKVTV